MSDDLQMHLDILDLSIGEFVDFCNSNRLFEACACNYQIDVYPRAKRSGRNRNDLEKTLKSCPHCGCKEVTIKTVAGGRRPVIGAYAECDRCGARGKTFWHKRGHDSCEHEEEAAYNWNRRHQN